MAVTDRHELALVLAPERTARPATGHQHIEHVLERVARPGVSLLLQLIELPERVAPAVLLAGDVSEQAGELLVLAIHRAEHEADAIEARRREPAHPELAGGQARVGGLIRAPGRPVTLVERPDPGAPVRLARALGLPCLVHPLVARQPVVGLERRVTRAAVAVAERAHLQLALL